MKILHINRNYVTSPLHSVMMSHLEKLEGIENTVFAPTDLKETVDLPQLFSTEVCVSKCFTKRDRLFFDVKQRKIMSALEDNLDIRSFDCLHAYTLFTDGNCAMKMSEKYKIPYIVAVRNTDVNQFFKKLPYLRKRGIQIMANASAVCFLSESYKKRVFEQYVPDRLRKDLEKKSYIIPNGIDDFWFDNIFQGEHALHNPLRFIYAGKIDSNKNIETTIMTIDNLKSMGIQAELDVVGSVYDEKVFLKIKRYNCVHYFDAVPKEKLINFYRESDIFVMPSFTESFGLVYAEAMSQGLPVVYTKGEGFDNQFKEGDVGYHVDPHNDKDIANAIVKICKNYLKISARTPDLARKFNWSNIVRQYKKLYDKIIYF